MSLLNKYTATEFVVNVNKFIKKTKSDLKHAMRTVGAQVYVEVRNASPVDTARFRDSWRVGVNTPDPSQEGFRVRGYMYEPGGVKFNEGSFSSANDILNTVQATDTIYVSNSLHYGPALEGGSSRKAPQGIMRVAIARAIKTLELNLLKRTGGEPQDLQNP